MSEDLKDTIRENAQGPANVRSDAGSVQQHSLRDQIEADKYVGAGDAVKKRRRGILFTRLVPPGGA